MKGFLLPSTSAGVVIDLHATLRSGLTNTAGGLLVHSSPLIPLEITNLIILPPCNTKGHDINAQCATYVPPRHRRRRHPHAVPTNPVNSVNLRCPAKSCVEICTTCGLDMTSLLKHT